MAGAFGGVPAVVLRSSTMGWWRELPAALRAGAARPRPSVASGERVMKTETGPPDSQTSMPSMGEG